MPASSASSAMRMAVSEASSAGLTTSVLPMASAAPATRAEDLQRIVPRDDAGHHAMRLAQASAPYSRSRNGMVSPWILSAGAAIEFVIAHGGGDIGLALADRLAGVARFQRRQLVAILLDQPEQPRQAAAALDRPASGPTVLRRRPCGRRRTARSTSAARERGIEAKTLPSDGETTSMRSPESESAGLPSITLHEGPALGHSRGKMASHVAISPGLLRSASGLCCRCEMAPSCISRAQVKRRPGDPVKAEAATAGRLEILNRLDYRPHNAAGPDSRQE